MEKEIYKSVADYAKEEGVSTSRIFAMIKNIKEKGMWSEQFYCKLPGSKTIYLTQAGQDFLDRERGKNFAQENPEKGNDTELENYLRMVCEQQKEIIRNQKNQEEILHTLLDKRTHLLTIGEDSRLLGRMVKFRHKTLLATVLRK